ncbi:hypothetical protein K2173_024791 [Erythroxylum novogranatense]|uniref:Uncharacterized protein n=1 Tax=Erythroxylum novogranatense TaxID=1862640 RepID=A0AAV8UF72_9ROSI|nr:hypothetical protein K2173_024791 [Erythroxylum novogranatense]
MISRHFTSLPKLPSLSKIPSKYKSRAVKEAQEVLTDYLHLTRLVPFTYAENISKYSIISLSNLIANLNSDVGFKVSDFPKSFQKFLRYHPINEFEFFYESIGIDYNEVHGFLPKNKFFFSEDVAPLNASYTLSAFGFPWNKLGNLCREETSVFGEGSKDLTSRLSDFLIYGFSKVQVIGICLTFPYLLNGKFDGENEALLDDLRVLLLDFNLRSYVEENVDAWFETCKKIRVFYDLGCEKGKMGELMGRNKRFFVDYSIEDIVQKANFFCRFDVSNEDACLLLLQRPEIFNFDLDKKVISVQGLLRHFGLSDEELESVARKYSHIMGRNKMANLPHVMRALDLHLWFFNEIKKGNHPLLASYSMSDSNDDIDEEYRAYLEIIRASRTPVHTRNKLDFVHGIGFAENALCVKIFVHLHGTSTELQERFDCLLDAGISFSNVCSMINRAPKIMNQSPEMIVDKVNYLCCEMGGSLHDLVAFPAFLCFDLEKRIKPRHRFQKLVMEKGLCTLKYSVASIVATSEKCFLARAHGMCPAALKHYFECLLPRSLANNEVS